MDRILGQMEKNGMFKVSSLTESIMMRILQCAMDRAHEKLKSKKGVLECLNGISKFYELAVLQLEGCLQFVLEERDQNPLESNYEDVLVDLMEIRDRLQSRVMEAEVAIAEKDMEFKERLANEMKLKQVVELKEKELVNLRANLELEKTKSGEMEEFIFHNRVTSDEEREGQFCELKNSVDQQVWNIKQQLESDCEDVDEDRTSGIDNKKVEQMGSDINVLKGTLDVAFGKMHNVMFLSELGPVEHRWRWKIERVITATVFKGSLKDFQERFEEEVKKRVMQVSVSLSKQLSGMLRDFTCLQTELELLRHQDEVQVKHVKGSKTPPLVPHPNVAFKGFLNARSKSLSVGDSDEILSNFSLKVEDEVLMEHSARDNLEEAAGLVAKMVKNHESIIRRKSDELNFSKRELFQDKRYPYFRREKEYVSLTRRIGEVVLRLESLINWSSRLGDIYGDCKHDYWVETSPKKTLADSVSNETSGNESLEEVWAKVNNASVSHVAENEKLSNEMRMLKQELGDANLRTAMVEETYLVLLRGLVDEFHVKLLDQHLWSLVKEGMYESFIEEIMREQDEKIEGIRIETEIIEEMYNVIFRDETKYFGSSQGTRNETSCLEKPISVSVVDDLERTLREDISTFLFQEVYREWNGELEVNRSESLVKEEIYLSVFDEIMGDVLETANFALSSLQETKALEKVNYDSLLRDKTSENVEMLVKDDIWKVLLRGIFEEWKTKISDFGFESLIREELCMFVIVEAVKGSFSIFGEAEAEEKAKYSENVFPVDKFCRSSWKCFRKDLEFEKTPTLSTGSESKDRNMHLDLVELNNKELDGHKIFQKSHAKEDNIYSSVSEKLEKDSTSLRESHFIQYESRSDQEKVDSQMTPNVEARHELQPSISQSNNNEEKVELFKSLLNSMLEDSEVFKDFEHPLSKRLEENIMRLDEVKHQLDQLVEPTASLSKKASLYRKAFLSRCDNLHKAETEVDLLGDQVDALLRLLEKLYMTLNQHAPVLQQYLEVEEIMQMIKKELVGGMNA